MIKVNDFLFEYEYNDSFAYRLFKALSKGAGLDLKRAVDKFNQTFPEIKTTPQNVSNKLTRDSIKLTEFCRFAEAFGYEIVFRRIEKETPEAINNSIKSVNASLFAMALVDGYASCPSPNFGEIVIAGKQAEKAAEWLTGRITNGITDAQEMSLVLAANKQFSVFAKPTNQR